MLTGPRFRLYRARLGLGIIGPKKKAACHEWDERFAALIVSVSIDKWA